MKDVTEMTEPELRKAIAKADALSSAICEEMIAAGRGFERPSDYRDKTDPLSIRANEASIRYGTLLSEKRRRMEWHGSLKRIRCAA